MVFWVIAAVLTLCACLAVLMPLMRASSVTPCDADFDLEVYRDQLSELDRDLARGVVGGAEAEQARAEIGRRILRLAEPASERRLRGNSRLTRIAATAAVLAIPLVSWGIYVATGSPGLPTQPLQARLDKNPADSSIEELVARAEGHLASNPSDGRGWDVLAPIYFRMDRYSDAATAFRNAIRLNGATADREVGLGEAIAAANGGTITSEAQEAFERALDLEPGHPKAGYLLAAAFMQEGKTAEAAEIWRSMLAELPEASPWRATVEQALRETGEEPAGDAEEQRGPRASDIEAAASLSDEDRVAMIETMVAGLDQRLRAKPDDLLGWQRLVHSYAVLGRTDEARSALERGLAALGKGSEAGGELSAFAAQRGLAPVE